MLPYSVFISYARKDYVDDHNRIIPNNIVSRVQNALRDAGISYWIDEEGLQSTTFTPAYCKWVFANAKGAHCSKFKLL